MEEVEEILIHPVHFNRACEIYSIRNHIINEDIAMWEKSHTNRRSEKKSILVEKESEMACEMKAPS